MKWTDRWAARAQPNAERHDEHYRQRYADTPAGSKYFRQLREVIQLLSADPVSGPDGIPVLICLSERLLPWSLRPKLPMPRPWMQAIGAERTLTNQAARVVMTGCFPHIVYAYTMSGPPYRIRRSFRRVGGTHDPGGALTYVLALAEDVRSRGVKALSL